MKKIKDSATRRELARQVFSQVDKHDPESPFKARRKYNDEMLLAQEIYFAPKSRLSKLLSRPKKLKRTLGSNSLGGVITFAPWVGILLSAHMLAGLPGPAAITAIDLLPAGAGVGMVPIAAFLSGIGTSKIKLQDRFRGQFAFMQMRECRNWAKARYGISNLSINLIHHIIYGYDLPNQSYPVEGVGKVEVKGSVEEGYKLYFVNGDELPLAEANNERNHQT